jgi:translocation and assembly module TamB
LEGSAWDQPIQDLSLQIEGDGNAVHATANVITPAGSGSAKVTYNPRDEGYDAQVDFTHLHLEQLQAVHSRNLELAGFVSASAKGRGTLKAPQLEATIEAPKLQIRQQSFDGLKAYATVTEQQADLTLASSVSGVNLQARVTVNFNSEYDATVIFYMRSIELGPLFRSYLHERAADVIGQTELHGALRGPLKFPERIEAHMDIPQLSLRYQSVQLASVAPLRIDYRSGALTLDRAELKGTGTDLQIQGYVPVARDGILRATVLGTADLHIVQLLNPDISSSGHVKFDIGVQGTYAHPDIRGEVHIMDGAFQASEATFSAEKVNAELEVQNGRVNIKSFTAETSSGTVTAQGFATYQPTVQFNVVLKSKELRVRYPEGVRAVLASNLTLNGTPDSSVLSGQILIDRISFTDSLEVATFAKQFTGPSSPPREGIAQKIKLNIALKSTSEMELSNARLSVAGSADLRVQGTVAEPILTGRTNITSGELFFNGRRYEVQSGVIQFPVRTEPVVNLVLTTTVNQFDLNVRLVGPIGRMRTTYTSDPPLSPVDVINLLIMGHTTEAASASPTTPQSILAGQMANQVGTRVARLAGISSLTIDPQIGGNGVNQGTRLALQQRVTRDLFFTFATDVSSTQEELVQIEYQITRKYSVSALRDQNGSYSVQMKVRKKF